MKARTRFSRDDLKALKAETEVVRERLLHLSRRLLDANLSHTRSHFYDERVRRVSDRLVGKLNDVDSLLDAENAHHTFPAEEMTV